MLEKTTVVTIGEIEVECEDGSIFVIPGGTTMSAWLRRDDVREYMRETHERQMALRTAK